MPGKCTMILVTRGSDLALAQTREVWDALLARFPDALDLHRMTVKTSGDVLADASLRDLGGKGAFVKEIDERVLAGEADVAVHSLKDVPTRMHADLVLGAVLPRRHATDALVSDTSLADLPRGAKVGTSSVRRRALLLRSRPDLVVKDIRGNVPTRVGKVRSKEFDGVVLSTAGLVRLGLDAPYEELDPDVFVPEPGQGAIACVCKAGSRFEEFLEGIDDPRTRTEVTLERGVLHALGGGCVAPVGVHARTKGDRVDVHAIVLSLDGRRAVTVRETVPGRHPSREAEELAEELTRMGAAVLLEEARKVLG